MQKYLPVLRSVQLFKSIGAQDIFSMLSCLGASVGRFKKEEFVLMEGEKAARIGILLTGRLHIVKEDAKGERILVASLSPGDFFAEALCCAEVLESPVSVVAEAASDVLFIEFQKILRTCPTSCAFHVMLIKNMLFVLAQKNILLQSRLDFLGKKSLRAKILSYLESFVSQQGRKNIQIPFNREELADFLCVDRSALSHELARMKKEGILDYHKDCFRLLEQ